MTKTKGYTVRIFDNELSKAKYVFVVTQQIYLQTSHFEIIGGGVSKRHMGERVTDYGTYEDMEPGGGLMGEQGAHLGDLAQYSRAVGSKINTKHYPMRIFHLCVYFACGY